ncbi:hypothetical protein, partial [Klebsiella pneumoniae]|uniref:hypothetical protein n=1 Tax=Klebsiella pneumoniae TaxID=573 RepID=UPI0035B7FB57
MATNSPWHHLYNTKRWYRLRFHQLQKQPLCEFHLRRNQVISATVVDHIKPHKGDETLFHNPDNLQSLCGFAPIFPDTCYHLTHYWPAAADIP